MSRFQNLHLADFSLYSQYRTLFKTNVSSAQAILSNSQLDNKVFGASEINDITDDISDLENYYYDNIPDRLSDLLSDLNGEIGELKYCGNYSSSTAYKTNNIVNDNNSLYFCLIDNQGSAFEPGYIAMKTTVYYNQSDLYFYYGKTYYSFNTGKLDSGSTISFNKSSKELLINGSSTSYTSSASTHSGTQITLQDYWLTLGLRGAKGYPTLGVQLKGAWNSATSYVAKDVVFINNRLYVAVQSSSNQSPPDNTDYWVLLADYDLAKINVNVNPSNLVEGDIYWQTLS